MRSLKLKTPPSVDPVSVMEVKNYLRVDGNSEDSVIESMIKAATVILEDYCDTKFIEQTWLEYHDCFPFKEKNEWWDGVKEIAVSELYSSLPYIDLMLGPIKSYIGLKTYPDSGISETFDPSNYVVDTSNAFGRIALKMGSVWPTTILRKVNGIEHEYIVGLSPDQASLPHNIKQAIFVFIARMYEKRGDDNIIIPPLSCSLLAPYRRFKV